MVIEHASDTVDDGLANAALGERDDRSASRLGFDGGDTELLCGSHDQRARAGQQVARLKSGDPFVFGRGAEEAEALIAAGLDWEVVPGISAGIAAPAYAGIPLLHRQHASSVAFVTGHAHGSGMTLGEDADTLVIFMCAATIVPIARALIQRGRLPTTPVALIRNGTLPAQDVRVGTLDELAACTESFSPPLIAVVGEVARLAQGLHWFGAPPRPLSRPMRRMA
ncbi:MAG: hypothetical protein NVS2B9_12800 [Myxococcales bacterium]